jgi:general secretion pathway protein H
MQSLRNRLKRPAAVATGVSRTGSLGGGFTLVELLVVLVILAALSGLLLIRFDGVLEGMELRGASRDVASALRYARGRAIATQQETGVAIDVESRQYRVLGTDDTRVHGFNPRIAVDMITDRSAFLSDTEAAIRFFPDGSSTGGGITLSSGTNGYHIDVQWLTGRVRVDAAPAG